MYRPKSVNPVVGSSTNKISPASTKSKVTRKLPNPISNANSQFDSAIKSQPQSINTNYKSTLQSNTNSQNTVKPDINTPPAIPQQPKYHDHPVVPNVNIETNTLFSYKSVREY